MRVHLCAREKLYRTFLAIAGSIPVPLQYCISPPLRVSKLYNQCCQEQDHRPLFTRAPGGAQRKQEPLFAGAAEVGLELQPLCCGKHRPRVL